MQAVSSCRWRKICEDVQSISSDPRCLQDAGDSRDAEGKAAGDSNLSGFSWREPETLAGKIS